MSADDLKEDLVFDAAPLGERLVFHSAWGLFSPKQLDEGSLLLLRHLDVGPRARVLDLGCGYGAIGLPLAKAHPAAEVHLVDKDFVAVEYTAANATRNALGNCHAYLSNGFSRVPEAGFDLVVSNLPAKVGRELIHILLSDAYAHLKPGGRITVVTISGLREFIKRNLNDIFGNYRKLKQGRRHTVAGATR